VSPTSSTSQHRNARARRDRAGRKYKPERIDLLLVAEAPPTALDRYFYFEYVQQQDSLFRYVCRAVLKKEPTRTNKSAQLAELRDHGVFLIDLQQEPHDSTPLATLVRRLVSRCRRLSPFRIILIKVNVFDAAYEPLRQAGLPVVNVRVPFPGSGQQAKFMRQMQKALKAKVA